MISTRMEQYQTHPPDGLGIPLKRLKELCGNNDDGRNAINAIDQVTNNNQGTRVDLNFVDNINKVNQRPDGTSKQAAHRKLRKYRPDLHKQVLSGELSPHAAMIEAGFRPKSFTIRITKPENIANTLKNHLSDDQLSKLRDLL